MLKAILLLAGLGGLLFAFSAPAQAQVGSNCRIWLFSGAYGTGNSWEPPLPPTATDCQEYLYEFGTECLVCLLARALRPELRVPGAEGPVALVVGQADRAVDPVDRAVDPVDQAVDPVDQASPAPRPSRPAQTLSVWLREMFTSRKPTWAYQVLVAD